MVELENEILRLLAETKVRRGERCKGGRMGKEMEPCFTGCAWKDGEQLQQLNVYDFTSETPHSECRGVCVCVCIC